jgi:hypothetical protein
LLNKARVADEAEKNEPELDIPAEIARRQDRLDAIAAARTRLERKRSIDHAPCAQMTVGIRELRV